MKFHNAIRFFLFFAFLCFGNANAVLLDENTIFKIDENRETFRVVIERGRELNKILVCHEKDCKKPLYSTDSVDEPYGIFRFDHLDRKIICIITGTGSGYLIKIVAIVGNSAEEILSDGGISYPKIGLNADGAIEVTLVKHDGAVLHRISRGKSVPETILLKKIP